MNLKGLIKKAKEQPAPASVQKPELPSNVALWGPIDVCRFLDECGHPDAANKAYSHMHVNSWEEIDGPALRKLTENDFVTVLGLSIGEASAIHAKILQMPYHTGWKPAHAAVAGGSTLPWAADVESRIEASFWGLFIGDALSMPAHWYYDVGLLRRDLGMIEGYLPAADVHSSSFILGDHWRSNKCHIRDIADALHVRGDLWETKGTHYHHGMKAGENTLEPRLALLVIDSLRASPDGIYDDVDYCKRYTKYMTTAGAHNDTYLNIPHRQFMYNWLNGVGDAEKPETFCGQENHSTASMNGLVGTVPILATATFVGREEALQAALRHVRLLFASDRMMACTCVFAELLFALWGGADPRTALEEAARQVGHEEISQIAAVVESGAKDDSQAVNRLGLACYTYQAFPAMLYLAFRHAADPETALLANTNAGGENCFRGSALGAVLGAANGMTGFSRKLIDGLQGCEQVREAAEWLVGRIGKAGMDCDGSDIGAPRKRSLPTE